MNIFTQFCTKRTEVQISAILQPLVKDVFLLCGGYIKPIMRGRFYANTQYARNRQGCCIDTNFIVISKNINFPFYGYFLKYNNVIHIAIQVLHLSNGDSIIKNKLNYIAQAHIFSHLFYSFTQSFIKPIQNKNMK